MPELRFINGRYIVRISLVALLLVAAFMLWVWPTPWRFFTTGDRVYRQERFTQCYSWATDTGWTRPPQC